MKCTKNFHPEAFQNIPKLVFLVWKYTIWQPWVPPSTILVALKSHRWVQCYDFENIFENIIGKKWRFRLKVSCDKKGSLHTTVFKKNAIMYECSPKKLVKIAKTLTLTPVQNRYTKYRFYVTERNSLKKEQLFSLHIFRQIFKDYDCL
jgi:hypothetical protein